MVLTLLLCSVMLTPGSKFLTNLNECVYFGPVWTDAVNEQQLSGRGWVLRGLCAHYLWKRDSQTLVWIRRIADNPFLPAAEDFAAYPINLKTRIHDVGGASGNTGNSKIKGAVVL